MRLEPPMIISDFVTSLIPFLNDVSPVWPRDESLGAGLAILVLGGVISFY